MHLLAMPHIGERIGSLVVHSGLVQAIGATLAGVLIAWAFSFFLQRRRIAWRDYLDAAVNLDPQEASRVGSWKILCENEEVPDPSLVLLRIRNAGIVDISDDDFTSSMEFVFRGREIRGCDIIDCNGEDEYKVLPLPNRDAAVGADRIRLARFAMNRGDRITLLVLLSGSTRGVRVSGHVRGGKLIREPPRRGPRTRTLVFGGAATLLLSGLLTGVFLATGTSLPSACGSGQLTLLGSTAFAPSARQIGQAYRHVCPGVTVGVQANGTFNGLNELNSTGARHPRAAAAEIAMSDGPAPSGYPALVAHPVGVIVFTLVVNRHTGVFRLTTAQVRGIFKGTITNWRQLGGADLPISIISRDPESGTRRTFGQKVLDAAEPGFSSYDCVHKNADPGAPVIRCEEPSTSVLLQDVARVPGAIGYAEASDVSQLASPQVQRVALDGLSADTGAVGYGRTQYHFWTVEQLYTYGSPPAGSLAAGFLGYLNSFAARDILRGRGYLPCADQGGSLRRVACRR
ncbi:MAG: substrate-binding domain-containing protein [Actinobacteria bacterium]|nr:substrate-binding domain-containing protein [Actinomycetota bacterium]